MFNSNLIMAVKVGGKVLREFDGTVALPFGSEYSIYLKNTSSRRASVSVSIDGTDVLDGQNIIVPAFSHVELKRFIKNGNLDSGNAFKFIEKTGKIEKFRGNKAEDGLLTVTYSFEREYVLNHPPYNQISRSTISGSTGSCSGFSGSSTALTNTRSLDSVNAHYSAEVPTSSLNAVQSSVVRSATKGFTAPASNNINGITAPGARVDQQFTAVYGFYSDGITKTMTLKLIGAIEEAVVKQPVTVKRNVRCTMCGTNVKQTAKFCHECGASVVII